MTSERSAVASVAAVQLVIAVDLALVLPLAPDLVEPLGVSPTALGALMVAYSLAAALSSLFVAPRLDRHDRRSALMVVLAGLAATSLASAFAPSFALLVVARALAGAVAAPALALVQASATDLAPLARRGRAHAALLAGNALGALLGIPAGLWLAGALGWSAAFVGTAALALVVLVAVRLVLPAMREHQRATREAGEPRGLLERREVRVAYAIVFVAALAVFVITPNLSTFVQRNLGVAREALPGLYMIAGAASLVTMLACGRLVDARGPLAAALPALLVLVAFVLLGLVLEPARLDVELALVGLLAAIGGRNVAIRTLVSAVPLPGERARFAALQGCVQQLGIGAGALLGTLLLREGPAGSLVGMPRLGLLAIAASVALLPLLRIAAARARAQVLP